MTEPYALTVAMLEEHLENLTAGHQGLAALEGELEDARARVDVLVTRIAQTKAQVGDVTRSLELLKAGT